VGSRRTFFNPFLLCWPGSKPTRRGPDPRNRRPGTHLQGQSWCRSRTGTGRKSDSSSGHLSPSTWMHPETGIANVSLWFSSPTDTRLRNGAGMANRACWSRSDIVGRVIVPCNRQNDGRNHRSLPGTGTRPWLLPTKQSKAVLGYETSSRRIRCLHNIHQGAASLPEKPGPAIRIVGPKVEQSCGVGGRTRSYSSCTSRGDMWLMAHPTLAYAMRFMSGDNPPTVGTGLWRDRGAMCCDHQGVAGVRPGCTGARTQPPAVLMTSRGRGRTSFRQDHHPAHLGIMADRNAPVNWASI